MTDTMLERERVLHISNTTQALPITEVVMTLHGFLDEESNAVLDMLQFKGLLRRPMKSITAIQLIEFEEDESFTRIPYLVGKSGLVLASSTSCLDLLYSLRGEENTKVRRDFFEGGFMLLSMDPFVIAGERQYLVIGQNSAVEKRNGQRLFSVRLLTPPDVFSHALYRVIAAEF